MEKRRLRRREKDESRWEGRSQKMRWMEKKERRKRRERWMTGKEG